MGVRVYGLHFVFKAEVLTNQAFVNTKLNAYIPTHPKPISYEACVILAGLVLGFVQKFDESAF